ncbi:hypothetical protein [Actinophytocola oryzae]|uniref:hypothetical protein n=1 Tax=Actinophytocola oryzae TaxID=502181 RepID=UPI001AB00CE6|nr:hypothetical protein [Actinophytocola oryzae]
MTGPDGVRPTRRCLDDLDVAVPDLGHRLDEIDNPIIAAAQAVPEQRDAGGAQRVLSLSDRIWFKVKTSDQRAIATQITRNDLLEKHSWCIGGWWVAAAGHRQADSPQRDFYESIRRECTGRTVSTARLLPTTWDRNRLDAELAVAWRTAMKRMIIRLICTSLGTGRVAVAQFRTHRVKALVRADSGHEAYLAIIAEGVPDSQIFAQLLDCVPGVASDDWQPEPSPIAEMEPLPGEIGWSTLFPSEVASKILALGNEGTH